jgi:hypothetical protein
MSMLRSIMAITAFTVTTSLSGLATAADNIQLLANGVAQPNTSTPPATQVFAT